MQEASDALGLIEGTSEVLLEIEQAFYYKDLKGTVEFLTII